MSFSQNVENPIKYFIGQKIYGIHLIFLEQISTWKGELPGPIVDSVRDLGLFYQCSVSEVME